MTEDVLRHRVERPRSQPPRAHFLGTVVLNPIRTTYHQLAAKDVVDGQQRLTTLQIFLAVARDAAAALEWAERDRELERLTENTCRMQEPHERFKVWPTESDQKPFEEVLTARSAAAVHKRFPDEYGYRKRKPNPKPLDYEAYRFLSNALDLYLRLGITDPLRPGGDDEATVPTAFPDATPTDRLDALVEALTHHLRLVLIELDDADDAQGIFESLNANGEPLRPSDLVRNFVFLEALAETPNVAPLYRAHWSRYDRPPWTDRVKLGRQLTPRFDLLLFHVLTLQTGRALPLGSLYAEFQAWWRTEHRAASGELVRLNRYSDAFDRLQETAGPTRLARFARALQAADTSTLYPVLLALIVERADETNGGALAEHLDTLESYLIRRLVCGLTPKNYNRTFLGLLAAIQAASPLTPAVVRTHLAGLQGESTRWPDDEEFGRAWRTRPAYTTLGALRTRTVLQALEEALHTGAEEGLAFTRAPTVEHVLPQTPRKPEDWPLPPHDPRDLWAVAPLAFERLAALHRFGNLTLLSSALNSSVSNGPFRAKRPAITAQSELRLNAYFQRFSDEDAWLEPQIAERGEHLFGIARRVWSRP